jgi:hypothetical protein
MESHKLNCPNCGHLQDNVVWTSLNVSLDPTLREKLFNGEINVLVCQKCGNRALISTALLYHDMKRKYCVQYYPVQAIEDAEFFKRFTKDGKLNIDGLSKTMGEKQYPRSPRIADLFSDSSSHRRHRCNFITASSKCS